MNKQEPHGLGDLAAIDGIDFVSLIVKSSRDDEMIGLTARFIKQEFDAYYDEFCRIPALAQTAFENRDPQQSLALSKRRLTIYSESITTLGQHLVRIFPLLDHDEDRWLKVEAAYMPLVEDRYEVDLALAYIQSVRRKIFKDEWRPLDYVSSRKIDVDLALVSRVFLSAPEISSEGIVEIMSIPGFTAPFKRLNRDADAVCQRLNETCGFDGEQTQTIREICMINAGFFRNRGAYVFGKIVLSSGDPIPLIIVFENDNGGIYVDAVVTSPADCHNIFSSTLANFHVTSAYYHELSVFLHSIMPHRPLGLHYSTIGFNHIGKVAAMDELRAEFSQTGENLDTAVGFRGTVAIGFSTPSSGYVLKIIRDTPTDGYKWGTFDGIESVLKKYSLVHDINRTGSMLDNVIYWDIKLEKSWFAPALLEELVSQASETVSVWRNMVTFKHLIVQLKMVPLPVYLETASEDQADAAITNLGHCIKNNASANIFNKDLDGRNYGVSPFQKVYLFDYDAVEIFTDVKIRTNTERFDGEEDVPDWYFEDGVVFLPEEMESGLRIPNRRLSRLFRHVHGDLMTVSYWEALQADIKNGLVRKINIYPEACKITQA